MVTNRHRRRRSPIANGLALAAVLDDSPRVTVVCFGDGATNTGAFHEAVNLAAVWDLPVIFMCQNNQYGEHTAIARSMRVATVAERAGRLWDSRHATGRQRRRRHVAGVGVAVNRAATAVVPP